MTTSQQISSIAIDDLDLSGLPKEYQNPKASGFKQAVKQQMDADYNKNGIFAIVTVGDEAVTIEIDAEATDQCLKAIDMFKRGNYAGGKPILEVLLAQYPANTLVLYNLGMVYSDEGKLDAAIDLLQRATQSNPTHEHAWIALAVALSRNSNNEAANEACKTASSIAPFDPYVLRTSGALLARSGQILEAIETLKKAYVLAPDDVTTNYALAESYYTSGNEKHKKLANYHYSQIIKLSPGSAIAEMAEKRLTESAYSGFRKDGNFRDDAMMYCFDALEKFNGMSQQEIAGIAVEAATIGASGIDVNNPRKTYELKTLSGTFNGLNVVCILHTAIQLVSPGTDSGFDVKAEYEAALKLFHLE
jgi:tetratricopeptide (TPR) repeat protein